MDETIALRQFGKSGKSVTCVGLGGEGVLRTHGKEEQAREVILEALAQGIGYFDSARVYSDSERYIGSVWRDNPQARKGVFQASKSASRDKFNALKDLEQSLERLQTSYLDLWQIHDVRTGEDIATIESRGGALEAFLQARSEGRVKAVGVTGHHDPRVLAEAVNRWPVDAVMLPVNPVEGVLAKTRPFGFLTTVLDAAAENGIGVIAMKVLGAAHYIHARGGITPDLLIRYALSFDVSLAIVGCSTPNEVHVLSSVGKQMRPLTDGEKASLESAFEPFVERLAFYRGVI